MHTVYIMCACNRRSSNQLASTYHNPWCVAAWRILSADSLYTLLWNMSYYVAQKFKIKQQNVCCCLEPVGLCGKIKRCWLLDVKFVDLLTWPSRRGFRSRLVDDDWPSSFPLSVNHRKKGRGMNVCSCVRVHVWPCGCPSRCVWGYVFVCVQISV